jgi:hypothetical protein
LITLEELECEAELGKKYAEKYIKEFREKLDENSAHALEWSGSLYEQAAKLEVYTQVLRLQGRRPASGEETVEYFSDFALSEVIRGARWPEHSTNPMSNYLNQCKTAAWADLYAKINNIL